MPLPPASSSGVDVITYHNDNLRTGQNLDEQTLTPLNVARATFGLLLMLPVDGKVDAQPLVLHAITMSDNAVHDVLYVATEHDSLYAFDANSGAKLWQRSLLESAELPSDARNCAQVIPEIGVTATPVIDRAAGTIFVVAMSKDSTGAYYQRLHALNLRTGAEAAQSPVTIAASIPGTGAPATQNGQIVFDPGQYKERAALLLSQGVIYTSWASHCDIENYTGWIIGYMEANLQQAAVFNTEPSGTVGGGQGEAAFWNSNSGPSADANGNIYAMTANGDFDTTLNSAGFPAGNDYGNSIVRLAAPSGTTMAVLDYFTMFNADAESAVDDDLGSGGLLLLPDQIDASGNTRHLAVGAGKDTNLYVVDRDDLGKFNSADNLNAYQFLAAAFPSSGCGPGVYGAPVYFNGMVYTEATGDAIRGYKIAAAKLPARGTTAQVTTQTSEIFCYPGPALAVSANGSTNGILWAVENSSSQAVLHAYDAANLATEIYNSAQAGTRDQFGPGSKFTPPTVANGKVFVGTQADNSTSPPGQNYVAVFGLL
ncbi:MAG: pyrrolo-quinoline quinone [Steroidobacteraceae bacterium]|jgi:outer membrane protein assembly factor BamB